MDGCSSTPNWDRLDVADGPEPQHLLRAGPAKSAEASLGSCAGHVLSVGKLLKKPGNYQGNHISLYYIYIYINMFYFRVCFFLLRVPRLLGFRGKPKRNPSNSRKQNAI